MNPDQLAARLAAFDQTLAAHDDVVIGLALDLRRRHGHLPRTAQLSRVAAGMLDDFRRDPEALAIALAGALLRLGDFAASMPAVTR